MKRKNRPRPRETSETRVIIRASTTTHKAGGLDFTAIGGKGGARSAPIVAVWKTQSSRPFAVKLLCKCAFIIQKFSEPGFNGAIVSSLICFQVFDKIG